MANIRKSFNFKNGVQVDNDNFVVNANGLVGIGTSIPSGYLLNVYGDTRVTGLTTTQDLFASRNLEVSGVTTVGFITASRLEVSGGVNVTGVLTASQFKVGNSDVVDNLIGYARTTFITDNGGVGLHTTSKIGINTSTSPGASDSALSVFGDVNITGVATASQFSGSLSGDVNSTGVSTFTTLKVGAVITASSGIVTATTFDGNLTGNITGTATTATNLASGANITTGTISDDRLPDTITSNINILSGTSYFNQIGVNTITPQSDIHVRKNIQAEIQVTSNSNASLIGLGRSNSITGYNGILRYGNTDGAFAYSDAYSLDIMNYGTGNINYYLNPSEIAGTTGGFFWHKETQRFMALTSAGNLGIGVTNPTRKLEVFGTSYLGGDVEFGNDVILGPNGRIGINSSSPTEKLDVVGNIAVTGSITAGSINSNIVTFDQSVTGSVSRTVESRLKDVISVKDFGAVGDGVTDDTVAIQAAIDYAETLAKVNTFSGKQCSVFLPDGVYEVTSGLTVSGNGIAIYGNNKGAVLQVTGTGSATAITIDDAWDTVISGLAFQANSSDGTVNSVSSIGIKADSPNRLNIINCDFYNLNSSIELAGSYQTLISDCRFNQNSRQTAPAAQSVYIIGYPSNTAPGGGIHIDNCEFTGSSNQPTASHINVVCVDGLYISNCHLVLYVRGLRIAPTLNVPNTKTYDVMVTNTYFDECTDDGSNVIFAGAFADGGFIAGTQFSNCFFRKGRYHIYLAVTKSPSDAGVIQALLFTGCKFQQAERNAVYGRGDSARIQALKFTGCYFKGNNGENDPTYSPISLLQPNCTMSVTGNTFGIEANPVNNLWSVDSSTKVVSAGNDAFTSTGSQPPLSLTLTTSNLTGQTTAASTWAYDGTQVSFRVASIVNKTVTANGTIDFGTIPTYLRPPEDTYFTVAGKYNDGTNKFGTMTFVVKTDGTIQLQSLSSEGLFSQFSAGDDVQTQPLSGAYSVNLNA